MQRSTGRFFQPVIRYVARIVGKHSEPLRGDYEYKKFDLELGLPQRTEMVSSHPQLQLLADTPVPEVANSTPRTDEPYSPQQVLISYAKFVCAQENLPRISTALFLTALSTAVNLFTPYFLLRVMNALNTDDDEKELDLGTSQLSMMIALIFIYALSQLLPNLREQVLVPVGSRNTEKLIVKMTHHLVGEKSLYYHSTTEQAKLNYYLQKVFVVGDIFTPLAQFLPVLGEAFITTASFTYQYGPIMGAGLASMLGLYTTYCAQTAKVITQAREEMIAEGSAAWGEIQSTLKQNKIIRDYNKLSFKMKKVAEAVKRAANTERSGNSIPLNVGLGHIAIPRLGMLAAMLYVGMCIPNQFTVSEMIALLGYLNGLCTTLQSVGGAMNKVFSSYPDLEFVFNELARPSEIIDLHPDVNLHISGAPSIQFVDLAFNYPGKPHVLNQLSFTIQAGQTVAFVSESGFGKSTLFNLLNGYYKPSRGEIVINGQDINLVSLASLQASIGLVGQNANLFNGSVRDNIKFGADNPDSYTDQMIFELAMQLNLTNFICSLSKEKDSNFENFVKGLNSSVGEDGKKLSGGEQQKVSILRGFSKPACIRLLDEVTAGLDAESSNAVLAVIKNLSANATTIIISHHLADIVSVDTIFVLDKGKVIAEGKHSELLSICPLYQKLWEMQHQTKVEPATLPSVTNFMGLFHPPTKNPLAARLNDKPGFQQ